MAFGSGRLGQLVIELAANSARLESDMGKAVGIVERGARKITNTFKFVAGAAGGGLLASSFINAGREAINLGDDLNKAAIKAGVSGKAISELAYAAKLADVDLASLSTSIKKMQVALSEARTGAKGPTEALHALGLEIADLQGLNADRQFELIGDRIAQLKDPADRTRAAVELFGKAGADLLPLFEKGAAGIRSAREEAERLGLAFGDDQLKKLAEADDAIKRLDAAWQGVSVTLTSKVAPALTQILEAASSGRMLESAKKILASPLFGAIAVAQEQLGLDDAPSGAKRGQGRRGGDVHSITAPGFEAGPNAAAIKAAAAAEKARIEGMTTAQERFNEELERTYQLNVEIENILADNAEAMGDAVEDVFDDIAKEIEAVPIEDTWEKKFKKIGDDFLSAFDNMVHNGKIAWDELLKYFATQLIRSGIAEAIANIGSGNSGGGFWSSIFKSAANSYGGARAEGGPISAGKFYMVGERGPEILAAGSSGSIVPNRSVGGSLVISPQYNIDARGATVDLIKALPRILKQNNEALKADLIEGSRRRLYPLGVR